MVSESASVNLFDELRAMRHDTLARALHRGGGGSYIHRRSAVAGNVRRLLEALRASYPNADVAYSYKTSYREEAIREAMEQGALNEVVSGAELAYARSLGAVDKNIILNGSGRPAGTAAAALRCNLTFIVDSLQELDWVEHALQAGALRARIGLRIAPTLPFVREASRFGIDLDVAGNRKVVQRFLVRHPGVVRGVHLHHAGDRSPASFVQRLDHLLDMSRDLGINDLEFVDLGGGLGSGIPDSLRRRLAYPVASLEGYGRAIGERMAERCPSGGTRLVLEPGTGLLADAGAFASPVIDVKLTRAGRIAVVDGTLFSIDPLRSSVPPEVAFVRPDGERLATSGSRPEGPVRLCGNSCMEIDVLHPDLGDGPAVGDIAVIAQKGAYAACMSSPFIQGTPATLAFDGTGFELLCSRGERHALDRVPDAG